MAKDFKTITIEGKGSKVLKGGTLDVDFNKQIMKIELKTWKEPIRLTCDNAYHLWRMLSSVFQHKGVVKKLKVYNLLGEQINLVEMLWPKKK